MILIKIKYIFWDIILLSPLLFMITIIVYMPFYYSSKEPAENIIKTIGCVKGRISDGRGFHSSILEFHYNGKTYKSKTEDGYVIGEKFIIEFEKDNPSVNRVNQDKPVFLKNESVGYTVGYVKTLNFDYMKIIMFVYYVNDFKYEQSYKPTEQLKTKFPSFREGKKFIVKYWINNPERSIILPDKPTNKNL